MEEENKIDVISVDVPLFIRLLEFAREDSTDDMQLHSVTEKLVELCQDGDVMTMDQYDEIVGSKDQIDTSNMNAIEDDMQEQNKNKMNEINKNRWAKLAGIINEEEEVFDLYKAWDESPESAPYSDVLEIFESYEDPEITRDFETRFEGQDTIQKWDYFKFANQYSADMSEEDFIVANWIDIWDKEIYDKAELV